MTKPENKITIAPGAQIVGVHSNTLRRLERMGFIQSQRNYLGYRIFKLEDLLRLKAERDRLVETFSKEERWTTGQPLMAKGSGAR